jgi:hypothetical protein
VELLSVGAQKEKTPGARVAPLDLLGDKSGNALPSGCPTPVAGRAFLLADGTFVPIACGRNTCPWCRRRNVMVTAAMLGLDALVVPPTVAITTTTRDWLDDARLREGTAQYVRKVRREVAPSFQYAWLREWTTGHGLHSGGVRRTHKHFLGKGVSEEDCDPLVICARDVWGRIAGATQHHAQPVWDAGGVARYVAGLVEHHLKEGQAPPAGWKGRRFGTSKGYYSRPASELRAEAEEAVHDERLRCRLEAALRDELEEIGAGPISDEALEALLAIRFGEERAKPSPRVVSVAWDFWLRDESTPRRSTAE